MERKKNSQLYKKKSFVHTEINILKYKYENKSPQKPVYSTFQMIQNFVYSTPLNSAYFVFMNWEKGWLLLSNYRSSLHILRKLLHGWSLTNRKGCGSRKAEIPLSPDIMRVIDSCCSLLSLRSQAATSLAGSVSLCTAKILMAGSQFGEANWVALVEGQRFKEHNYNSILHIFNARVLCNLSHQVKCGIFYFWHHVSAQKISKFGVFRILDFWIKMLNLFIHTPM